MITLAFNLENIALNSFISGIELQVYAKIKLYDAAKGIIYNVFEKTSKKRFLANNLR